MIFRLAFLLLIFPLFSFSKVFVYSDFDLTLNSDIAGGTWNTNMVLFPVKDKSKILDPVILPYRFFNEVRDVLSKDCSKLGDGLKTTTFTFDHSNFSFVPANYCVTPDSFIFHRSDDIHNYLLEDLLNAIQRHPTAWQGPFFEFFANALQNPKIEAGIITAREQSKKDWGVFFRKLKELNYIERTPALKHVHNVSLEEYRYLSPNKPLWESVPERKGNLILEILQSNNELPVENEKLSNFLSNGKKHVFIFADDNQDNVKQSHLLFSKLSNTNQFNYDYILFNAGTDEEVSLTGYPRFYRFQGQGKIEVLEYSQILNFLHFNCSNLF